VKPGVLDGYYMSGSVSGQINKWYFPWFKRPSSLKTGRIVEPRGFFLSYDLADDLND